MEKSEQDYKSDQIDKIILKNRKFRGKKKIDQDAPPPFPENNTNKRFLLADACLLQVEGELEAFQQDELNLLLEGLAGDAFLYARLKENEKSGHVVLDRKALDEETKAKVIGNSIPFKNASIIIKELEDPKEFWTQHGKHFERILRPKFREIAIFYENGAKNDRRFYVIGGIHFDSISKVKNILSEVLAIYPIGSTVDPRLNSFIKDVLNYHNSAEEKLKGFDHIEVNYHPKFTDTKCFHVVREDGTKTDFSFKKLLKNIIGQWVPLM